MVHSFIELCKPLHQDKAMLREGVSASTVNHFWAGYWDPVVNIVDKLPSLMELTLQSKKQQAIAHGSNSAHNLFL